jgi:hypothetical protein
MPQFRSLREATPQDIRHCFADNRDSVKLSPEHVRLNHATATAKYNVRMVAGLLLQAICSDRETYSNNDEWTF